MHSRRISPINVKPSLHSNETRVPGVNWKFVFRPNRGVSSTPQDINRLIMEDFEEKMAQNLNIVSLTRNLMS